MIDERLEGFTVEISELDWRMVWSAKTRFGPHAACAPQKSDLRRSDRFRKAFDKATALFQMDWRLGLIMDLQLASQTPLIEL
jgi:hypothetical protein